MKKIFIPILLGFALTTVSCQGLLDIPQKGVVSYDTFYASDADAEAALTSVYANFASRVAGQFENWNAQLMILNYSADDVLAAGGDADDHIAVRVFDEFRYSNETNALKEFYNRYYLTIYHANLVISNFTDENRYGDAPKYTSAYTNQCVAEARVMRAYLHMMAALSWNCPPIMDRLYDGDELPVNAESQSQVLEWVIAECEKAISSGALPKRNGTGDKNATARMSVGFAQFVAGKAAMFNNDPATARKYLGALIASGDYALVPSEDYWTNFHVAGDGNSEKIFESNFIEDPNNTGFLVWSRARWQVHSVLMWKTQGSGNFPALNRIDGWNGGAIQADFAKKFLAHDGNSPRRLATFITGDEYLYEIDWRDSEFNDGTLEQKKSDPKRGVTLSTGMFSRGPYFEWKHMSFENPPKILTGGKEYPSDNVDNIPFNNVSQKNFSVARYAEALLLYAEACIGSGEEAAGLKALQAVQERSGSGKISDKLTFEDIMEEKQYEMWFENCRFHDLVRWSKQGKVNLDDVFNKSGIHETVTILYDEFFIDGKPGYKKEHKLYTEPTKVYFSPFIVGKHEYLPFPNEVMNANPNLHNVLGWASAE